MFETETELLVQSVQMLVQILYRFREIFFFVTSGMK